eukprot:SAG11_NODE_6672_length_1270_cov_1.055508_3_plen_44_part_01
MLPVPGSDDSTLHHYFLQIVLDGHPTALKICDMSSALRFAAGIS